MVCSQLFELPGEDYLLKNEKVVKLQVYSNWVMARKVYRVKQVKGDNGRRSLKIVTNSVPITICMSLLTTLTYDRSHSVVFEASP